MPLISVLLPSRGRPDSLQSTIAGLRQTATEPGRVEVLVSADDDDPVTHEAAWIVTVNRLLVSERRGYARLHEYVNALAAEARGTWLLIWNDDAVMLTEGWDEILAAEPAGLAVLHTGSNQGPTLNPFPILTRDLFQLLGHVSVSPHCDSYLEAVSRQASIERRIGIHVRHDRYDLTGQHKDQTFYDSQDGYRTGEFHGPGIQNEIAGDVAKIKTALDG